MVLTACAQEKSVRLARELLDGRRPCFTLPAQVPARRGAVATSRGSLLRPWREQVLAVAGFDGLR